jgi:FHS family L-fucose permease-like MFS transporter
MPFITMIFLFLIIGFLTTANAQFQGPLKEAFLRGVGDLKNTFATLITFSWFLAYPLCGGIGSAWITKYAYKGTLIRSLFIMIAGLGLFFLSSWFTVRFPNAILQLGQNAVPFGFFIFLLGSFVVGASATILQVVINPYLTACSIKGTQPVQRLAIGGSANSIGTTIAPFFVTGIVFGGVAMEDVQVGQLMIPFLSLMAVIALIVGALFRLSLPDIQGTKAERGEKLPKSVWSFRHLTLGVIAIFFYVGVEVCIGANINLYAIEQEQLSGAFSFFGNSSLTLFGINFAIPALMATLYWGGMLIGRLIGSSLKTVHPRIQLTATTVTATALTLLSIGFNNPWLLTAVGLFHSIMWGAIFTLSVAKLGKYTSVASGVFMIGVVGGAILPLLQGFVADAIDGWRWSWFIVVFGELFMLYYALAGSRIYQSAED